MFKGQEEFKFHIRFEDTFTLERLLFENDIDFHNELEFQTNSRSNKYYIRNSDRIKFDKVCTDNQLEIFIDSLPNIETRFPKITSNLLYIVFSLFMLILIIILIISW